MGPRCTAPFPLELTSGGYGLKRAVRILTEYFLVMIMMAPQKSTDDLRAKYWKTNPLYSMISLDEKTTERTLL